MNRCKYGLYFISFFLISMGCVREQPLAWIPFNWEGDTISGKYIEKAFIYVPVKIEDLPQDFTMQLDLGMDQTVFYGNTIEPYHKRYPSLVDKYKVPFFYDVALRMGPVEFPGVNIGYYANFGDVISGDSLNTATPKHIGTIGSDIFYDKILVIDYKSSRFAVTDSLPANYKDWPAEKFELQDGFVKISFQVNGEKCKLIFDTGSSPFQLATSKDRALEISDAVILDSLSGPLWWGKEITFYGLKVNKPIAFGGETFEKSRVYYDKEGLWNDLYNAQNVWGITGNAYFSGRVVVVDYKNKLFRVK